MNTAHQALHLHPTLGMYIGLSLTLAMPAESCHHQNMLAECWTVKKNSFVGLILLPRLLALLPKRPSLPCSGLADLASLIKNWDQALNELVALPII